MIKVSVVVPVYNVEKFLHLCVDSLLNQTFSAHEIILVDDGAKDSSGRICDEYADKYDIVKVVHKENAGLGMARNTGLDYVTGNYVVFVDSDDFCQSDMIERLVNIVNETGCDTCKTSFNRVDMEGRFLHACPVEPGVFKNLDVSTLLLPRMIGSTPEKKDSIPMSACCTMYSMDIINQYGLRFVSERVWISEDLVFNIDYYAKAQHVVLSDYIGYNYRTNTNSLTTTYRADRFEKCLALYQEQIRVLTELGLFDICKNRLIRQFFIYLRMCFSQLSADVCKLPKKEVRQQLREICNNAQVQNMIAEYPVHKMGIKQQVFVYLVRYRCVGVLRIIYGMK